MKQPILETLVPVDGVVLSAMDAIVVLDDRLRVLVFNPAAERMFGVPERQAVGVELERFVADRSRGGLAADVESAIDGPSRGGLLTFAGLRPDGGEFPCEASIAPHTAKGGRLFTVVIRDITQRTHSQESLRRQIAFETFFFDLSRTLIGLPEEHVDENMVPGLGRVGAFLGLDRVTLLELSADRKAMTVAYSWSAGGVAAPSPRITAETQPWWLGQVMRGQVTLAARVDDLPSGASREKQYLCERGVVSAASIPLRVGGEIAGAITFATVERQETWPPEMVNRLRAIGDIFWNALKRHQAMQAGIAVQAQVRESEERFRLIASTAPVIIWMSDADNRTTYVNESWTAMTGLPLDAALGAGWADTIHSADRERCREVYTSASAQHAPFSVEYRLRCRGGEFRWAFAHGVPRYDADGAFAGYIGSAIDVTERKEAEDLLSSLSQRLIEAQEQERARVARELHDDINQRLALLLLSLEIVRQRLGSVDPHLERQFAEAIATASTLTSDVQNLSHRLHSSRLQTVGLESAARGVCRELSDRSGVEIEFQSEGILAGLPDDVSICLYRVLQEALQNAIKHSGSRQITVSLRSDATAITLAVRDVGKGSDRGKALKNRGLGLVSMKERLKLVDGQLTIEARSPAGTAVRAVVPLNASPRGAEV